MQYLGVKLCGNCNPQIDGYALAKDLAATLGLELVLWDDPRAERILVVNGCSVGCIQRPALLHINGCAVERSDCRDGAELRQRALQSLAQAIAAAQ